MPEKLTKKGDNTPVAGTDEAIGFFADTVHSDEHDARRRHAWSHGTVLSREVQRLRDRYERNPGVCNSGHTGLPICLWDCPTCAAERLEAAKEAHVLTHADYTSLIERLWAAVGGPENSPKGAHIEAVIQEQAKRLRELEAQATPEVQDRLRSLVDAAQYVCRAPFVDNQKVRALRDAGKAYDHARRAAGISVD